MSFSSKLELRMTWHERRVRWRNLRAKPNLNRVPQFMPQVLLCTILLRSFLFWVFLHGYQSTCQHLMPCRAVGLWVCLYDFFQHGSSKIFILTDCITVITGYKRGERQHLGSNHHLLQLASQRPNHRRPTGGRKLYLDYSGFQGCSDCWEKSCSNPSTTRGGSGGGRLEFFLSRLILSSMDLFYISYHPGGLL